jgi:hypothetical protein
MWLANLVARARIRQQYPYRLKTIGGWRIRVGRDLPHIFDDGGKGIVHNLLDFRFDCHVRGLGIRLAGSGARPSKSAWRARLSVFLLPFSFMKSWTIRSK